MKSNLKFAVLVSLPIASYFLIALLSVGISSLSRLWNTTWGYPIYGDIDYSLVVEQLPFLLGFLASAFLVNFVLNLAFAKNPKSKLLLYVFLTPLLLTAIYTTNVLILPYLEYNSQGNAEKGYSGISYEILFVPILSIMFMYSGVYFFAIKNRINRLLSGK